MKIQIEKLSDSQFTILVDGKQAGQCETETKAKASARRFFPPNHHVKWHRGADGLLMGVQKHWTRKMGESF